MADKPGWDWWVGGSGSCQHWWQSHAQHHFEQPDGRLGWVTLLRTKISSSTSSPLCLMTRRLSTTTGLQWCKVHSNYYNVRTLPYTDENTWCFPVVLPQVAWGDLMNYVRTNSWAYQLPYVPTDVGWRVLLATCRLLIHLRQARGSSRVGGLLPDMQVDRSSPVVHQWDGAATVQCWCHHASLERAVVREVRLRDEPPRLESCQPSHTSGVTGLQSSALVAILGPTSSSWPQPDLAQQRGQGATWSTSCHHHGCASDGGSVASLHHKCCRGRALQGGQPSFGLGEDDVLTTASLLEEGLDPNWVEGGLQQPSIVPLPGWEAVPAARWPYSIEGLGGYVATTDQVDPALVTLGDESQNRWVPPLPRVRDPRGPLWTRVARLHRAPWPTDNVRCPSDTGHDASAPTTPQDYTQVVLLGSSGTPQPLIYLSTSIMPPHLTIPPSLHQAVPPQHNILDRSFSVWGNNQAWLQQGGKSEAGGNLRTLTNYNTLNIPRHQQALIWTWMCTPTPVHQMGRFPPSVKSWPTRPGSPFRGPQWPGLVAHPLALLLTLHIWTLASIKTVHPSNFLGDHRLARKKECEKKNAFGSWDVEKVHAVVARSTFPSQNVQSTTCSRHFWRFRCRKGAQRCGAKHISKSKCTKHHMFAPFLEVPMWKKCTPLWRETHVEVKMFKTPHVRGTFGGSDVVSPRFTTIHYITLRYTTLHYTALHYTTLHSTTLHNITTTTTQLHSTTLHYLPLHLHYTTLHSTRLQLQLQNCTPLRSTTLHYTPLHYTTLHFTALHYITLHYTTFHYTPLHYNYTYDYTTTLHYTTLHYTTLHWMTLHHR